MSKQGNVDTISRRTVSMKEAAKMARAIYEEMLKREELARELYAQSFEEECDYWDWEDAIRDEVYPDHNPVIKDKP